MRLPLLFAVAALCVPFALSAAERATTADSQQQFGLKLELLDLIPKLTVEGPGGQPARVDRASDVAGPWTAWSNVVVSAEGVVLVDLAPSSVQRFYRAIGNDMTLIPAGVFTMGDFRVQGP